MVSVHSVVFNHEKDITHSFFITDRHLVTFSSSDNHLTFWIVKSESTELLYDLKGQDLLSKLPEGIEGSNNLEIVKSTVHEKAFNIINGKQRIVCEFTHEHEFKVVDNSSYGE